LTKSINEFLWKTALAKGCFCFHKSSSYSFQTVFHPSDDRLSQSQMWLRLGRAVLFCSIQSLALQQTLLLHAIPTQNSGEPQILTKTAATNRAVLVRTVALS
jgi:hypothetical protein